MFSLWIWKWLLNQLAFWPFLSIRSFFWLQKFSSIGKLLVKIYSISKLESLKSFSEQEKVYLEFFLLKCFLFCSKKKKCKISYEKLRSLRHVSVTTKFVYLNGKKMSSKTIIVALNVRLLRFMVSFQKKKKLSICVLRFVRTFSICRCYYF